MVLPDSKIIVFPYFAKEEKNTFLNIVYVLFLDIVKMESLRFFFQYISCYASQKQNKT